MVRELCLKIQYPGVAEAVDSDLNGVAQPALADTGYQGLRPFP